MSALQVEIFVGFFAVALGIALTAERIGIPAPALLVVAGVFIHGVLHVSAGFSFGPALLFLFLPPLIFEAAWSLDLSAVKRNLLPIMYLAVPGTLLTAGSVAFALAACHILPIASACILGSIVAATDPVAVVGIFRRMNVPESVKAIVEAESLANDGIAVVLYNLALQAARFPTETHAYGTWLIQAIIAVGGGVLIGGAIAILIWLALRVTRSSEYEVAMTVVLAFVSYLMAERAHSSGIIASAIGAITLRSLLRKKNTIIHRDDVNIFWSANATLVNTFVFFITGLSIDPVKLLRSPFLIVLVFSAMVVSRAFLALSAARSFHTRVIVFLAGMRGALALALALSLPGDIASRELIIDGVAAMVVLSLLMNGIPLEAVIRRIYREVASTD